jgi:uncharacterized protein (TIRG00374 family)
VKKRYLFSLLIAALCLWLAFRQVNWGDIVRALGAARYSLIGLFVLTHVAGMAMRTMRWRLLLGPVKRTGLRNLLSALSIGFMANFIFPARAGEVIRAYLIGRREGISKTSAFATIVLERLFDGFAILLFLALTPLFLTLPPGDHKVLAGIKLAGGAALGVYLVIMGILVVYSRHPEAFLRFAERACRPLPRRVAVPVSNLVRSFGQGLDILGNPGHMLAIMGWSLAIWVTAGVGNLIMLSAFDLRLPLFAGFFLLVVQSFGVMVPSPGFIGAFQYAHVLGLSLFGVSREVALSLGILLHGMLFTLYIAGGVFFLWLEGMGLGAIRPGSERDGGPDAAEEPPRGVSRG